MQSLHTDIINIILAFTFSLSLMSSFIFIYLYLNFRERYLFIWLASSLLSLVRLALIDTPISSTDGYMILLYQGIFIFASFLQLIGTIDFNGSKPSRTWLLSWFGLSVISIFFTYITVALDLSFFYRLIFFCLAFGFINLQTGFLFLNHFNCGGWGKYITSGTLFIIGLHALEVPFYFDDPTAKWGFLIDAGLRLFLSVGILILYCEKTHYNLTLKEQQYRLLAENATDVIYQFSFYPAPHFKYISPSIYNLTGYSPALFYKNVQLAAKITHPDDRDKVKILRRIINPNDNKSKLLTFRIITSTGEIIWVEQSTNTFYDENNKYQGFVAILRDITKRRALEQDLSKLESLKIVGQMAASVAHEIRNPLTTVSGYLQLFLRRPAFKDYVDEFNLLLSELDRANQIIREYLSLSQSKLVILKKCDLNFIIKNIFPLIQAYANSSSCSIQLVLGEIPEIKLDEKEIRQLLLNLVRNGLEAMHPGGIATIKTTYHKNIVALAITDQGTGIPKDILENIGKPFVTTKATGTGLGLATCYQIANRHNATINIETSRQGTTFTINFPV